MPSPTRAITLLASPEGKGWLPAQVEMVWGPSTMKVEAALEAEVNRLWSDAMAAFKREGKTLFDGPMARLEGWNVLGDRLRLTVSRTSYRYFYILHMLRTDLRAAHPLAAVNPVGVSVALVTADGQLLLGRRSNRVAYYPNRIHPFAGSLEPDDVQRPPGGVFAAAVRELHEELNLGVEVLSGLSMLGIAQDENLRQPEAVIECHCELTADEIIAHLDPAEHDAVLHLPAQARALEELMLNEPLLTPVCRATLDMWIHRPR